MAFAVEDKQKSWYYFLSTLLLVITAFFGTYLIPGTVGKLFCAVMAALLTSRLFVIYHDYHHEAILRKSTLANVMMTILGVLMLAPPSIWSETHDHHHTNNSKFSRMVIGSFPTISTKTFRGLSKSQQNWYLMLRHPLMIGFAYIPIFLVSFCLWPFFENPKKYFDCGIAAVIHGLIFWTLYVFGGWSTVFFSLLLPCTLMFAIGGYIFYAQHNFRMVVLQDNEKWDYLDAALNSSSFIKMNRLMRWFTANIGFHHIHHVNSRIPFYRLPEAMEALVELQQPKTTSLHPIEIWKSLQLKLWDPEKNRLITLGEL